MDAQLRFCPACASPLETRAIEDQGSHPVCTRCGYVMWRNLAPCVDALILRGSGRRTEVLLGRRSEPPAIGKWDTPGGFLNVGDTPESRLLRACLAEVGVEVRIGELLCAVTDEFVGTETLNLFYRCETVAGDPRPGGVVDQVQWFPLLQLPDLAFPAVSQAMTSLQRGRMLD